MGLFARHASEEKRHALHRKNYARAVRKQMAPYRRQYVGRCFVVQTPNSGPVHMTVVQIDDVAQVVFSAQRPGHYGVSETIILPLRGFLDAVEAGRMTAR